MSCDHEQTKVVASPCVRNCCLNSEDICIGCFRHIDEILAWTSYKNNQKETVISVCEQRRAVAANKIS